MADYLVMLDNGHGQDTPDKRSPKWADGTQLLEYEFNRDVVKRIARLLSGAGIRYKILVPEVIDISLGERCRRANNAYDANGGKALLISIHANAGGGTGFEAWTSVGRTKSDDIATSICNAFERHGAKVRKDMTDGDPDKESQFYVLKNTKCPAVLTENFFMDTESDCRYIMSDKGRDDIAEWHVEAIKEYLKSIV